MFASISRNQLESGCCALRDYRTESGLMEGADSINRSADAFKRKSLIP